MGEQDIHTIKADLARRIAAIEWRGRTGTIAGEVDTIRTIARAAGMLPAVTVAQAVASALARGERGPLVHGWLAMLHDAVGSERQDRGASDAFAAACAVRQVA